MLFAEASYRIFSLLPQGVTDYGREVGDGMNSSTVTAPLFWIARTFPEAPPMLWRIGAGGVEEPEPGHPLLRVLQRPNEFYSGVLLWMATIIDWKTDGNAYWFVSRNRSGTPLELWWMPHWMVDPKGDDRTFITHYEYRITSGTYELRPEDVVHFRFGMDSEDPRRGLSPLKSVLREIFTDDEAAKFTASLLRNMGVPGVIVSPDSDEPPSADDLKITKAYVSEMFSGERRGEPLVLSGKTKVEQFGFSPEQLTLRELRRIPEERVTAVLGVPAIVAGLGAGLDRSTFCLPGDARVWTPNGPSEIRDIQPGQIVWSFADGGIEPRRVKEAGCTGVKPLREIRTKNRTVRATGNHPFLVRVPGSMTAGANHERHPSYEWRPAAELEIGDRVVQPKSLPDQGGTTLPDGTPADARMMQFLGALVGDGTVNAAGVRMAMPPGDRCVGAYREMASALFTKQARQSGGDVAAQDAVERAPVVIQERERDFGFSSAAAARMLVELGFGGRAHTKRVPSWVWAMSREHRLAFLAGLVDTDGHIDKRGALTFTFCNRSLTFDVRDLLVSVGIQACNVAAKTVPNRLPQPGLSDSYQAWTFTASSAQQVAEIPFADPLYRERVHANRSRHRSDGFDSEKAGLSDDLGFYEIKSIRELPPEPIYDLEIEGSHSFVADGIVVHNTNYNEAREAAYEESIIPSQRLLAEDVRFQLLPLYGEDPFDFRVGFDHSKVRVLQEDLYRQALRLDLAVRGGWAMVKEARRPMGLDVDDERDSVFLRPANATQVDGQTGRMSPLAASRNGSRNGAEHEPADVVAERVVEALRREELANR